MEYIKMMRKYVDYALFMVCACDCLLFNDKVQVLHQKISNDCLWENSRGFMDLRKTIYETIIREIIEETNLYIEKENLKVFNIFRRRTTLYLS